MGTRTAHGGRRIMGLVGWFLLLGLAIALFTGLDDPRLATPGLTDWTGWTRWAGGRDPIFATIAVLRLVLVGLTWYLIGATTIQVIARLTRNLAMVRIANALSVPFVRQVVSTTLGVGLAASMVATAAGGAHGGGARDGQPSPAVATATTDQAVSDHHTTTRDNGRGQQSGPTMQVDATGPTMQIDVGPSMQHAAGPSDDVGGRPTMQRGAPGMARVADPTAATDGPGTRVDLDAATPRMVRSDDQSTTTARSKHAVRGVGLNSRATMDANRDQAPTGDHATTWTVRTGDHLWHVAATVMGRHLDRVPSDEEVADYWQELVEANRDRLVDRDNPDLILPGQEFMLPSPAEVA